MKLKVVFGVLGIALFGFWLFYKSKEYAKFEPVKLDQKNQKLMTYKMPNSKEFNDCVVEILKKYNVSYKIEKGEIKIPYRLKKDMEIIWNYTIKAKDLCDGK